MLTAFLLVAAFAAPVHPAESGFEADIRAFQTAAREQKFKPLERLRCVLSSVRRTRRAVGGEETVLERRDGLDRPWRPAFETEDDWYGRGRSYVNMRLQAYGFHGRFAVEDVLVADGRRIVIRFADLLAFEADLATGAATYVSAHQGPDQRLVATFTGCRLDPASP